MGSNSGDDTAFRPDLGQHCLCPGAVAGVPAVVAGRVVAVVAQVLGHLGIERGLEHGLGQPGQQPTRADELDPVCAGSRNDLLSKLLLIDSSGTGSIVLVMTAPPAEPSSACRTSFTEDQTAPSGPPVGLGAD